MKSNSKLHSSLVCNHCFRICARMSLAAFSFFTIHSFFPKSSGHVCPLRSTFDSSWCCPKTDMCDHGWAHKAQRTQDVSSLCAGVVRCQYTSSWQHVEISRRVSRGKRDRMTLVIIANGTSCTTLYKKALALLVRLMYSEFMKTFSYR